jgi:formylglycine-generating enzyme required for sulfatase activity
MDMRHTVKSRRLFIGILAAAGCLPTTESKPDDAGKPPPPAAASMIGKEPGQTRDDNGLKLKVVWFPPGEFTRERPRSAARRVNGEDRVAVTLTTGIWLGKFEVTQAEWKQVMTAEPWNDKAITEDEGDEFTKAGDDYPATFVNWNDAMEFCRRLTDRERQAGRLPEGWEYTLPTDAQWEYACRAGTNNTFSFGDDESQLGEYAWYVGNLGKTGQQYAHQVGRKKPNAWGLHDMHGNVWEWCRDWYLENPPGGRDPETKKRPGQYKCRATRGGSWSGAARFCQSVVSFGGDQEFRGSEQGFRVALSPSASQ